MWYSQGRGTPGEKVGKLRDRVIPRSNCTVAVKAIANDSH